MNRWNLQNPSTAGAFDSLLIMASVDALQAFSFLSDNLPTWITRVSDLAAHTSAKHAEYCETYRRHAAWKPRRRKNSSVCSIHSDDLVPIAQRAAPTPEPVEVVTTTTHDPLEPAQRTGRKRGSDEAPSIDSSERYAFVSTRHNVIIEYDGHTQKELEGIVLLIGTARNNIRRGKMSTMPSMGFRAGLLSKSVNMMNRPPSLTGRTEASGLPCVRSTLTGPAIVGNGVTGVRKESPFDFADKQLQLAHGLCETAADQVLRSGDCGTELDGVEEKFKMLLQTAKTEVERLTKEKEEEPATDKEASQQPTPSPATASLARVAAVAASKPSATSAGAIEVDDASSISAESIDLSAFRSARNRI